MFSMNGIRRAIDKRRLGWAFVVLATLLSFRPIAQSPTQDKPPLDPGLLALLPRAISVRPRSASPSPLSPSKDASKTDFRTVLVLGLDDVAGSHRADTIMLGVIQFAPPRVFLISIPRDLRVRLPGRGWDKVNAAYAYGGVGLSLRTIQDLLDLSIDYHLVVNYPVFKRIVDRLGGLEYTVERRMHYVDRAQGLVIDLHPGRQHLDGDHALQYVRYRGDSQGDIGRIARQQRLLQAALAEWRRPVTIAKFPFLLPSLMALIHTNLTIAEAVRLVGVLRQVPAEQVRIFTLPGTPVLQGGVSYLVGDLAQIRRTAAEFLQHADLRHSLNR